MTKFPRMAKTDGKVTRDPAESHLHSDVEPRNIEGLKHDLGRVLSVLRCVQWRLRLGGKDTGSHQHSHTLNYSEANDGGFYTQVNQEQRFPESNNLKGSQLREGLIPGGSSGPPARPEGTWRWSAPWSAPSGPSLPRSRDESATAATSVRNSQGPACQNATVPTFALRYWMHHELKMT